METTNIMGCTSRCINFNSSKRHFDAVQNNVSCIVHYCKRMHAVVTHLKKTVFICIHLKEAATVRVWRGHGGR